jgi:hypothetical protein
MTYLRRRVWNQDKFIGVVLQLYSSEDPSTPGGTWSWTGHQLLVCFADTDSLGGMSVAYRQKQKLYCLLVQRLE